MENIIEVFDEAIVSEAEFIKRLNKNSKEYADGVSLLCELADKSIEAKKIENSLWEVETRIHREKEQNEIDNVLKQMDMEIKDKQAKTEKLRIATEFGKGLIMVSAFVLFEVLAHNRDMCDIIDRDQMHVRKNPLKLKIW